MAKKTVNATKASVNPSVTATYRVSVREALSRNPVKVWMIGTAAHVVIPEATNTSDLRRR